MTFKLLACSSDDTLLLAKFPRVPCQVLGAPAKMGLLILSCFKEIEFGNGDATMEIPRTT